MNRNFVRYPGQAMSHERDLTVDSIGHGTMCAGILLHAKNVIKIMNLKVGFSSISTS